MDRIFKFFFQFPDEIENAAIRFTEVTVSTQTLCFRFYNISPKMHLAFLPKAMEMS
jgi:hypothetical protein